MASLGGLKITSEVEHIFTRLLTCALCALWPFFSVVFLLNCKRALCVYERTLDLCCLCCFHLLSQYFFSSSFVCGVYFHLGVSQPSWKIFPPGWPTLDSGTCSLLVEKSVLASFLQAQHTLMHQAVCLCQSGLWGGDKKLTEGGPSGLQVGREKLPAFSNWGRFSFILVFHLVLSFCLCSLSLSLCRFLLLPLAYPTQVLGWALYLMNL